MTEMTSVSRFFVNLLGRRKNPRRVRWLREHLRVPPGAACLEIGCGNGDMASGLCDAWNPLRYVATDLDPRQTAAARRFFERRYGDHPPPALSLQGADMLRLPFPSGSFGVVLCFEALHHASPSHHDFNEIPRALAEIDRVLNPGGIFVYEEFLHLEKVRAWLENRHYRELARLRRRRSELVVVSKGDAKGSG